MSYSITYVDILLPLALPQFFTYSVPDEFLNECCIGKRVLVQFGKKKNYSGLIVKKHQTKPKYYETKNIIAVIDNEPIVNLYQLKFWKWISDYYLCTMGEVFKAALPAGLKLESETKIKFNNNDDITLLDEKEHQIVNFIKSREYTSLKELNKTFEKKITFNTIQKLINKNKITILESVKEKYKPKFQTYVYLNSIYHKQKKLHDLFTQIEKAPKQLAVLMNYISLSRFQINNDDKANFTDIEKATLLKKSDANSTIFNTMVKKGIFETKQIEISRLSKEENEIKSINELNEYQLKAFHDIQDKLKNHNICLLHGVTSSGKTEIYIQLIQKYLKSGMQVLYLLPEIALTSQIIIRLKKIFGNQVGIYHSRFSDAERVEIWNTVNNFKNNKDNTNHQLILGARSSIFLPFNNLGLIIVDEEHENSFKQFDPAPRYHARDAATILAKIHNAKVLLGTATPSIETYYNCLLKKYALVELNQRYKNIQLPEILIADTKEARRKKQMKSIFSPTLLNHVKFALDNDEQVILFQNRRGFSPYLECKTCGWIPNCENCDVSLTYHKYQKNLSCHYCGFSIKLPENCLACGDTAMQTMGFGTEKIEDELAIFFPKAKVARMDMDTTRTKKAYERIIGDFENKNTNILVGTQMITKGLDFDNVSIVGVMNADNLLNFPDFRAFERSFQLMAQVSGRAGRSHKRGKVIIQTNHAKHEIINYVINNNFEKLFKSQIAERKQFKYPPFYKLIKLTVKHKNNKIVDKIADELVLVLQNSFKENVLGPEYPLIGRIQSYYLKNILIKIDRKLYNQNNKNIILKSINYIKQNNKTSGLYIYANVDPY